MTVWYKLVFKRNISMKFNLCLKTFVLLSVLAACTSPNSPQDDAVLIPLNLTSPQKEFPLSSFIDSVTTLRLTLPDSMFFGAVSRIYFEGNNIYAEDYKQHVVFRFDRSGRFLNSIGRQGGGPGEYTELSGSFLGKDCLFLEDLATRRIFSYSPDGTFIRNITFPFSLVYDDIVALSDSNFLCYQLFCPEGTSGRGLWIMNAKGEKVETVWEETDIYPYTSSMFARMTTDTEGIVHAFNPSSGEFYRYDPVQKTVSRTYQFQPDVKLEGQFIGHRTTLDIKDERAGCDMAIESDHYLYTLWSIFSDSPRGRGVHVLYHKQTGELTTFERPLVDLPGVFSLGLYVSSNYPNALVLQYSDEYFSEYYPKEYKELEMKENMLLVKVLHFK